MGEGGHQDPSPRNFPLSPSTTVICHLTPPRLCHLWPICHLWHFCNCHICHISELVPQNIQRPELWWGWSGSVKECNPKTSSTLNGNVKCETANAKKFSANGNNNIHSMRRLQLINQKLTIVIINWPDIYWHHLLFHICEHLSSERPSCWGQPWVWVFRLVGGRWPECSTSSSVTKLSSQKHPPPPTTAYCPRT